MITQIKNAYLDEYQRKLSELRRSGRGDWQMYSENRREMVKRFSWAIPNDNAINEIAKLGKIIELGAGSGYWASLISQAGAEIVCFDNKSFHGSNEQWIYSNSNHYPVAEGSYEKLSDYPDYALMLCWPDYDNSFALDSLRAYRGDHLVYIGEPDGGCTGCDDFHRLLSREWTEVNDVYIEQWDGIHDRVYFYERDSKA